MKLVELTCPNCGSTVNPVKGKETAICNYCNTTLYVKRENPSLYDPANFTALAIKCINVGNLEDADEYADNALEIDANYSDAWEVKAEIKLITEESDKSLLYLGYALEHADDPQKKREVYMYNVIKHLSDPFKIIKIAKSIEYIDLRILEKVAELCEINMFSYEAYGGLKPTDIYNLRDSVLQNIRELSKDAFNNIVKRREINIVAAFKLREERVINYSRNIKHPARNSRIGIGIIAVVLLSAFISKVFVAATFNNKDISELSLWISLTILSVSFILVNRKYEKYLAQKLTIAYEKAQYGEPIVSQNL